MARSDQVMVFTTSPHEYRYTHESSWLSRNMVDILHDAVRIRIDLVRSPNLNRRTTLPTLRVLRNSLLLQPQDGTSWGSRLDSRSALTVTSSKVFQCHPFPCSILLKNLRRLVEKLIR